MGHAQLLCTNGRIGIQDDEGNCGTHGFYHRQCDTIVMIV